ncbi:B-cell differentiation antigen CD72 [Alligator mississippiensis]|uniref:B-cell differentiation antigen CD72 n=1 Tax=Alligator mississippiensis TaxID=8496 RepID=UPI0006EC6018|nr:B-cell differentiation antigen CD72 [Alligator mississippiensis]
MAESVTYADLRFSKVPLGRSVNPWAQGTAPPAPGEADGSYENLHLDAVGAGPAGSRAQQWRDPRWSARPLPLVLLAACLALLATTIALGVCYWQQGQRLQEVSHAHAAESHSLWQQVGTQEQRLGQAGEALVQAQEELARTRAELAQAWQEGNRSQEELQETRTVLRKTRVDMERVQERARDLQQQLDESKRALASARPCQVTDCCPETWVLHRGKCLFLSKEKKNWEDSKEWCKQESAQLLVLQDQDQTKMPSFLTNTDVSYWIGLQRNSNERFKWTWVDGTPWTWVDGTLYTDSRWWEFRWKYNCGAMKGGSVVAVDCFSDDAKLPAVCEKLAREPGMPPEPFLFPH